MAQQILQLLRASFAVQSGIRQGQFDPAQAFQAKYGDGGLGWAEQAPFDRIMVTAASPTEPTELLKQLKPNGVLVAPVGRTSVQMLHRYVGQGDGSFHRESLTEVRFVPLVEGTAKEG